MASKARDVMFSVFGEKTLPPINTHATPIEIVKWKKKEKVIDCYRKLFLPMDKDSETWVLTRIVEKVLPKKAPLVQIAYVIAVCTTMLNPKFEKIKLVKPPMKKKVAFYYVSFCNFVN